MERSIQQRRFRMSRRRYVSWVLVAGVVAIAIALTTPVFSQGGAAAYKAPRLAFGEQQRHALATAENAGRQKVSHGGGSRQAQGTGRRSVQWRRGCGLWR